MNFIPHNQEDIQSMLSVIGLKSIDDLFKDIPKDLILNKNLDLPDGMDELELTNEFKNISDKNITGPVFTGAGAYNHFVPALVDYIISRGEFLTAYTPYQPEISQGTLRAVYDYQSMICELTGMDVANASMYDGASSTAEAMILACNVKKNKKVLVSKALNPNYIKVLNTYANANNIEISFIELENLKTDLTGLEAKLNEIKPSAVIIQNPNFFGEIEDYEKVSAIIKNSDALFISVVVEALSLALLKPAGEYDADIVAGEAQSFGNRLNFGGPYLGLFAADKNYMRKMPGRLVGKTTDADGNPAYVLTLSTREQHIRREKATSNICSNHNLCAIAACVYLTLLGPNLTKLAQINYEKANYTADEINKIPGFDLINQGPFFNEFVIKCKSAEKLKNALAENGITGAYDLSRDFENMQNHLLFCVTEMNSDNEIQTLLNILSGLG